MVGAWAVNLIQFPWPTFSKLDLLPISYLTPCFFQAARIVKHLDKDTVITYQMTTSNNKGLFFPRDFVFGTKFGRFRFTCAAPIISHRTQPGIKCIVSSGNIYARLNISYRFLFVLKASAQ
jgi:hypothetical protein